MTNPLQGAKTLERAEIKRRKEDLTRRIRALIEERAELCIADKAREQSDLPGYLLVSAPQPVVIRINPGCRPTTSAFNAGLTRIMRVYGLKKSDAGCAESMSDREMAELAFAGETNPRTGERWLSKFALWEWVDAGPILYVQKKGRGHDQT